jgi:hypothetical protein
MFFYNGNMFPQSYERGAGGRAVGMGPSGVEHVGDLGFVCRLVVLDAVAYRKSQGRIPATAEMLPIPKQPGEPGIVTADDVRAIVKAQGRDHKGRYPAFGLMNVAGGGEPVDCQECSAHRNCAKRKEV